MRVLEVLEYAGTPAAKQLLDAEAKPGLPLSRKARAALERLERRPAMP